MNKYSELELIIQKNNYQKEIYKPSSFWKKASEDIIKDIEMFGIENFRNLETPLGYFVPTYGVPANSFSEELKIKVKQLLLKEGNSKQNLAMDEFISGYFHALSDFRVFMAADVEDQEPFLTQFSESTFGNPKEQFEFNGNRYSRSALNYILGLCLLKKHLKKDERIKTVLEIGGGFGTLGEILSFTKNVKYIDIDIPPVSFIAWKYLESIYGNANITEYINEQDEIEVQKLKSCSVFNSWDIEKITGEIDLFVNFISFQEMEPSIVQNYLNHVKRLQPNWILLRNMREGKNKKRSIDDIGVEAPIKKDDYIKMIDDEFVLVDSNVFPFGYKTVDGFHSELLLFKRKKNG